jgi:hypothetical protein
MDKNSTKSRCAKLYQQANNLLLRFGPKKYLLLTLSIFVLGFFMAAIMTRDKEWWVRSTCSLGMRINGTPEFYNYSFIIVGVMLIIFVIYLKPQIQSLISKNLLTKTKTITLTILYFIEIITLILVGAIPYGDSDWTNKIHVWFGFYVFINLGIAMFFAFWFFRKFSKKFLITNYILLIIGMLSYFLGIGAQLLPYAIAEMITIIVVLSWMGMTFIEIDELSKIKK